MSRKIGTSGIYCIENIINHKKYIGKGVIVENRWDYHRGLLKNNKHKNMHLQQSYNKYGEFAFVYGIIEECVESELINKEIYYVALFESDNPNKGYNLTKGGEGMNGAKHSEESKRKMSIANKGKRLGRKESLETRQKQSEARKGNQNRKGIPHTEEDKLKISKAIKGKKRSEETKQKMRKPKSEKFKDTISKLQQGRSKIKSNNGYYLGVTRKDGFWCASISYKGKKIHIGSFDTELIAAIAYNLKAIELFGENAVINDIPEEIAKPIIENFENIVKERKERISKIKSEKSSKFMNENNPNIGTKRSQEEKDNLSKSMIGKKHGRGSSEYFGVSYITKNKRWKAAITINRKYTYLGLYKTEIEAAKAYDNVCWNEYHRIDLLNFPEDYINKEDNNE